MISRIRGKLVQRDTDRVEVETASGVFYELEVPLTVASRLPPVGTPDVEILTAHVVREDSATLYGFLKPNERELFVRLMGAQRVGAKLALSMLSSYTAERLARAIAERDVTALTQVSGVGKKTAERILLDLADKVQDLVGVGAGDDGTSSGAREAVSALMALGYSFTEADEAVRHVLEEEDEAPEDTQELIRRALATR